MKTSLCLCVRACVCVGLSTQFLCNFQILWKSIFVSWHFVLMFWKFCFSSLIFMNKVLISLYVLLCDTYTCIILGNEIKPKSFVTRADFYFTMYYLYSRIQCIMFSDAFFIIPRFLSPFLEKLQVCDNFHIKDHIYFCF